MQLIMKILMSSMKDQRFKIQLSKHNNAEFLSHISLSKRNLKAISQTQWLQNALSMVFICSHIHTTITKQGDLFLVACMNILGYCPIPNLHA